MTAYEVMVVFKPQLEEEELANAISRLEETIKNINGEIAQKDQWGKRRLAYEIAGFNEGYYLLLQTKLPKTEVQELDRVLKISYEVIRHMIVKLDT